MTATAGDDATLSIDGVPFSMPAVKIAALIPMSDETLADRRGFTVGQVVGTLIAEAADRTMNPWRYRDRNPMPRIVPFPRLARAQRRARAARVRLHDTIEVLRHGLPETDW